MKNEKISRILLVGESLNWRLKSTCFPPKSDQEAEFPAYTMLMFTVIVAGRLI